jgi:hypothetical protein
VFADVLLQWDSYDANGVHRDLMSLQACFFSAQEILRSTGAYLRQFLVDDKGCVLIACWGMPHLTYLDNAHRALSAAAQIRRKLVKQEMTCSFGITTGDVYCGTVGSALRMEYAAIGSVVNMSARLMCKANGGILVDDATHARLPASVTGTLQSLPPMKVKGRDEPLQVFVYVSTETVRVKEKVAEDHEIPVLCRDALLQLVDSMQSAMPPPPVTDSPQCAPRKKHRQGSLANMSKLIVPVASFGALQLLGGGDAEVPPTPSLRIVLVKGKAGSGKTTVVRWLRKQAEDRCLATYSVRAGRKDAQTEYAVWTRLFHLMAPQGVFLTHDAQRSFLRTLLGDIYPGASQAALQMAFPVLRSVLGFTCTYSSSGRETRRSMDWMTKKASIMNNNISVKAPPAHLTLDVLHRVFAHLMNVQTSLFILENVELCDECSLKLLLSLRKVVTNSGLVVTALDEGGAAEETSGIRSFFHTRAAYHQEALKSTAWAREYERLLTASIKAASPKRATAPVVIPAATTLGPLTVLTLANYTPAEVDRMLCAALKVSVAPPELSQLVQDFSGGSFFWVREILQFIQDHGSEQFLSAAGETEANTLNVYATVDDLHSRGARPKLITAGSKLSPLGGNLKRGASTRQLAKGASFRAPAAHRAAETPHQVQLNKLVLCRFGSLSSDVQRVLRTASIIGLTFTSTVLQGVVAPQLRDQLADHFQSLLNQRWLYQDVDDESLYQFAHPHAHQIIYELTPSSERASIHRQVAEHMERALLTPTPTTGQTGGRLSLTQHNHHHQPEDKAQYGLLSFHYQQAGCEPAKALAYAAKAVEALLQQVTSIYDYGDCLDLLTGCVVCCNTPYDVDTMLTLVNRTRIAIREFGVGAKCDAPPSCVSRLLAVLSSFGASNGSGKGRVVPGGCSYEEGHARIGYDAHPVEHSLHAGAFGKRDDSAASIGAGSANSSNRSDSGARTVPIAPLPAFSASAVQRRSTSTAQDGDCSDEKGAKRRFLQQVAVLYDDLCERYVEVADEIDSVGAAAMAPGDYEDKDMPSYDVREKSVPCTAMDVPVLWRGEFGRKT